MKTTFVGLLAGVSLLMAAVPAAAARLSGTPQVYGGSAAHNGLGRRPSTIVYSGDGAAFIAGRGVSGRRRSFGRLHWTRWNRAEALAWGADWHDNCIPDCADGTYSPYRANVKLFHPEVLGGHEVFGRMTISYTGARPPYPAYRHHRSWTARLAHDSLGYFWRT